MDTRCYRQYARKPHDVPGTLVACNWEDPAATVFELRQSTEAGDYTLQFESRPEAEKVRWALHLACKRGYQTAKHELKTWLGS